MSVENAFQKVASGSDVQKRCTGGGAALAVGGFVVVGRVCCKHNLVGLRVVSGKPQTCCVVLLVERIW